MTVILRTGFRKVAHKINFQPQTLPKGQRLVDANHVINAQELRENGISYMIKAEVIRQASVSCMPYSVKLYIDSTRNIQSTSCTCTYNKSKRCKHLAALILYINSDNSLTKTNYEQLWGRPSEKKAIQERYAKGRYFNEMFPTQNKLTVNPFSVSISELHNSSHLKIILLEAIKDDDEECVQSLMQDMLETLEINLQKEECKSLVNTLLSCNVYEVYSKVQNISKELNYFYQKSIVLSRDKILELALNTVRQSGCDTWFKARYIRISASKDVYSIQSRKFRSIEAIVGEKMFPKKLDVAATRYGRIHETDAKKEYERLFQVEVKTVGVIVSEKQPWLCASLDGIVLKNSKISKIVEFKCPSSCEKKAIIDFIAKKPYPSYLKLYDGVIELRQKTTYYTQCQVQMYIAQIELCDLFIYTPVKNGSICIPVSRNEMFIKEVILKCEQFYFQNYLPSLCNKVQLENIQRNDSKDLTKGEGVRHFTGNNIINTKT
ncbi:uncharacterized protein [Prorops nasuta]|uniref:uncharacterized protein n=1 Tax=Prorops nasuta TaxID=863751 RepID=UPI0034CD7E36